MRAPWLTLILLATACYRPSFSPCAVACASDSACPGGTRCDVAEGFCQADLADSCAPADAATPGNATCLALSAGRAHVCAISNDHTLWCWGQGRAGELGNGDTSDSPVPVRVGQDSDWLAVDAGDAFTCGIRGAALPGDLYCWGYNNVGQAAPGRVNGSYPTPQPTNITGRSFVTVSAGLGHACAIDDQDHLWCWGFDDCYQTGTGPHDLQDVARLPTQVGILSWSTVSAGAWHTCGVSDGALYCWGSPRNGSVLGTGDANPRDIPTLIAAGPSWEQVSATDTFTCALRGGQRFCWGGGSGVSFGASSLDQDEPTPKAPGDGGGWTAVAVARFHGCGLRSGRLLCWGENVDGAVGTGDLGDRTDVVEIGTDTWLAVAATRIGSAPTATGSRSSPARTTPAPSRAAAACTAGAAPRTDRPAAAS